MSIHCKKHEIHKNQNNDLNHTKIFGFWLYIMSDSILFATLFAIYHVLKNNIADGPSIHNIFELPIIFIETCFLLISSITYNIVILSTTNNNKTQVNIWIFMTFLFGLFFTLMEIYEFNHLINNNFGPWRSAFLSSLFTLLGTHVLHVIAGLIWILVMIIHVNYKGLTYENKTRLQCLSLFWHFLDIIWICIFSEVYLIGTL